MSKQVPFVAHIRIIPARGSGLIKTKRFETWRDMQKLAVLIHDSITNSSINLADPGGGQHIGHGGTSQSGLSGLGDGGAVVPQIGESPALVRLVGFYTSSALNIQPHPAKQLIHAGETLTGPGATPWENNPVSTVDTEVASLKSDLETDITAGLPGGIDFSVFRIDYSGVVYGDRGYHFPQ